MSSIADISANVSVEPVIPIHMARYNIIIGDTPARWVKQTDWNTFQKIQFKAQFNLKTCSTPKHVCEGQGPDLYGALGRNSAHLSPTLTSIRQTHTVYITIFQVIDKLFYNKHFNVHNVHHNHLRLVKKNGFFIIESVFTFTVWVPPCGHNTNCTHYIQFHQIDRFTLLREMWCHGSTPLQYEKKYCTFYSLLHNF